MADRVLFIGWNRPVIGREKQALNNFSKGVQYMTKLQADGRIESFDTVILDAHGGDLNGFHLVKCSTDQIVAIRQDSVWIELMIEAGYCVEGIGAVDGTTGEGISSVMTPYMKLIG
jgi:hypothetical protein